METIKPLYKAATPFQGAKGYEFELAARDTAKQLGVNVNDLLRVMYHESSGLNPQARNYIGAYGLFQMLPSTMRYLNVKPTLTAVEQIKLFPSYVKSTGVRLPRGASVYDIYFSIFFPAAIGQPDDWTLEAKSLLGSTIAKYNPGFDLNKDNVIQVKEVKQYIDKNFK